MLLNRFLIYFFYLPFTLALLIFSQNGLFAQEHELSHKPANYNQDYFLNDPLPNLEVYCFPNPTYDTATFEYEVKEAAEISLKIYNDMGHKVDEPLKIYREPGTYTVKWSPLKLKLKGGVYYARVGVGEDYRLLKVRYIE